MLKHSRIILLLLSIYLFSYTLLRAISLGLTYDESFTFLNYVKAPLINSFIYFNPNNHFLNTLLIKLSTTFLGNSELAIRLPNLLGYLLFLIFSYLFLKKNFNKILIVPFFIIINFNPYLIEFFGLGRGYGLSMSMIMVSLYYLSLSFEPNQISSQIKVNIIFLSSFFGMLSVLANLTSLNFYIALIIVIFIINFFKVFILQKNKLNFRNIFDFLINKWSSYIYLTLIILVVLLSIPVTLMKLNNQLYFGGNKGFWLDTVFSLVRDSLYNNFNFFIFNIILFFVLITFISSIIFFFYFTYKNHYKPKTLFPYSILFIFILSILSSIAQNILLKTNYLIDRTALFFLFLFLLNLTLLLNSLYLESKNKVKKFVFILICFLAIIFTLNLFNNFNMTGTLEWHYDQNTNKAFQDSEEYIIKSQISKTSPVNLCTTNLYSTTLKYYLYKTNLTVNTNLNIFQLNKASPNNLCTLYYTEESDLKDFNISKLSFIKSYPETKTNLFKLNLN